jgi:hypothetical protein
VSKVGRGVWVGTVEQQNKETGSWAIPVLIRNGSELPVKVDNLDLTIRAWGYNRVLATPEITGLGYYADKKFGKSDRRYLAPGTIAPGTIAPGTPGARV